MKALSLRQPWAYIVTHWGKVIENRHWNTDFRGEFLIHAAKGMEPEEYQDARDFVVETLRWQEQGCQLVKTTEFDLGFKKHDRRGGIVGRARLVRVLPRCQPKGVASLFPCDHPWHIPDQFGFVLADVAPVPFVPFRGMPGFFDVPDDLVRAA